MRPLILHIHIFKNAGTSVDTVLKKNFGDRWIEQEFRCDSNRYNFPEVLNFIKGKPNAEAISVRSGDWYLYHRDPELFIIPIVFLRHPLLRIKSAYSSKANHGNETLGARLARNTNLCGYIDRYIATERNFSFRNFQARRLAAFTEDDKNGYTYGNAARRALDALPFVGIVEDFDASLIRLFEAVAPVFPDFTPHKVRENVTNRAEKSPQEALEAFRVEIGEDRYQELERMNEVDLIIYDEAVRRWAPHLTKQFKRWVKIANDLAGKPHLNSV